MEDSEDQREILGGEQVAIILPQPDTTQPVLVVRTEEKFMFYFVYITSVAIVSCSYFEYDGDSTADKRHHTAQTLSGKLSSSYPIRNIKRI